MSVVLSPSQVGTYGTTQDGGTNVGCPRKFGFKYLDKLPDPAGAGARDGKTVHTILEQWLRFGKFPNKNTKLGKAAIAMLKHLPEPLTEEERASKTPRLRIEEHFTLELDGTKWRGIKDLVFNEENVRVVHDHKSTSALKWAKTEEDLRCDVQSLIYARSEFQDADVVDLEWLYGTREDHPKVLPVRFNITFDEVQRGLGPIIDTGKRILKLYEEKPKPNTLPVNLEVCHAFNGCPYSQVCERTPAQRMKALMLQHNRGKKQEMGYKDRMKGGATETVVEEVKTEVKTTTTKPTMADKLAKAGIMPTPFEKTSTKEEDKVPDAVVEETTKTTKRGRPAGSKNRPKVQEQDQSVFEPATEPDGGRAEGFVLCVNTFPKGPFTYFSDYVRPVLEQLNAEHEVGHYRQIDFKAAGVFAAALYTYLEQSPPTGHLVVDVLTNEGADALPTLERFAKNVYRRF